MHGGNTILTNNKILMWVAAVIFYPEEFLLVG
jgi:hypothetical protein